MKAPEKLYLRKRNKLPLEVVRDEWYEKDPQYMYGSVEYTRTDAFIEKAGVKLKELMFNLIFRGPLYRLYREEVIDNFVETFQNYMKGE